MYPIEYVQNNLCPVFSKQSVPCCFQNWPQMYSNILMFLAVLIKQALTLRGAICCARLVAL